MAQVRTVTPQEASALLTEGYVYVDVRSEPEFEAGHVPGALNVPISRRGVANAEFMPVMEQAFGKHEALIIGCQAGGRSRRAVEQLVKAGFENLADMSAGMDGSRDAFGRPTPGWKAEGLPVEPGTPAGQSFVDVKQRSAKSG